MKLLKAIIKTYRQSDKIDTLLTKLFISIIPFVAGIIFVENNYENALVCGISILMIIPFWVNVAKVLWIMFKDDFQELIDKIRDNME